MSSRVVNVSSLTHRNAKLEHFKSGSPIMRQDGRDYGELAVYAESKLSNILFTFELTRRLNKHNVLGVTSVACHPGITSTNLLTLVPQKEDSLFAFCGAFVRFCLFSKMYRPILYAPTGPDVESNDYYGPGNFFGMWGQPKRAQPSASAHDKAAAENLWNESERLAKLRFDL
ncbi:unnamed protein product [Peronospora belbahrii]|nr:unnamed protein product [Peronospora belbahrii]